MDIESMGTSVENDEIGPCRNAEEYAVEWLEKRGGPVSPAELAEEYDCTPGHMQDALRDSDEITRVEIGRYVLTSEIDTESTGTWDSVESGHMHLLGPAGGGTDGSAENHEEQRDDVPGGQTGEFSMDSGHLQRQRELATETVEEDDQEEKDESVAGIPLPVDSTVLIAGVSAIVLLIVAYEINRTGTTSSPDNSEQHGRQPADRGLIGE